MPGRYLPERTADNSQAVQLWSQSVSPRMFQVATPIISLNSAAPPTPPSDAYIVQAGIMPTVFTTGAATLTLPQPFPSGWLSLQLTGGNDYLTYSTAGATLQTVHVAALSGDSGTFNIDVWAVGW